jgi:hypothetical protein
VSYLKLVIRCKIDQPAEIITANVKMVAEQVEGEGHEVNVLKNISSDDVARITRRTADCEFKDGAQGWIVSGDESAVEELENLNREKQA